MSRKSVKGIVLAGGKSSRFGEDKATAKIEGVTLLERTVHLLRDLELEPIVITSGSRDYSFLDCRIEKDVIPDQGPFGGLYTACRIFKNASLLVLTCDMPGVTLASLNILLKHHEAQNQVTLFEIQGGWYQPFPGIYESILSELILERIKNRTFSLQDFLRGLPKVHVVSHNLDPKVLLNVNEKKDLTYRIL